MQISIGLLDKACKQSATEKIIFERDCKVFYK